MKLLRLCLALLTLTLPAMAQDDDKGYITRLLESSLAGEGRTVQINGFQGALSRQAKVASIVILDDTGPWLTMTGLTLQLNRTALLRGAVEVEELSAQTIDLARLPVAPPSNLPPAEAQGFSLPEIPVSVDIRALNAERIILGAPVLGERAELKLNASASLIGNALKTVIKADRIDGTRGRFLIDLGFVSEGETVTVNIDLDEGEGGIAARLMALPDTPSLELMITGNGPLNDLQTDIKISTDGIPRLSGAVTLTADTPTAENSTVSRKFRADIGGDVTALFAPQYRSFFGDQVALKVEGQRDATGALNLSVLDLKTQALQLNGAVALNRDNWPTLLDVTGTIATDDGTSVILPVSGVETRVKNADLNIQFDQKNGNIWTAAIAVTGLNRTDIQVEQTRLNATGTLDGAVNAISQLSANINLDVTGVALSDPTLARAAGNAFQTSLRVNFIENQPLRLSDISFDGADFTLSGSAEIGDLDSDFETVFDTRLTARDISRFSDLAGQPLAGAVDINLKGSASAGGAFDIALDGLARGLKAGQSQADALLRGDTRLALSALRNAAGTNLRRLDLRNEQLSLQASGVLNSEGGDFKFSTNLVESRQLAAQLEGPASVAGSAIMRGDQWTVDVDASGPFGATASIQGPVTGDTVRINFDARLPDIRPLVPGYNGAVTLRGIASQIDGNWSLDTDIDGPYGLVAKVNGLVTGPKASIDIDATLPDINPLVAQYRGPLAMRGNAAKAGEQWRVDTEIDGPYGLSAAALGVVTGPDAAVTFSTRLPDINPLVPQFRGVLAVEGSAEQSPQGWRVDTALQGPYGLNATVAGRVTGQGAPNVTFAANLPDIAPLVPNISGPLRLNGDVQQTGADTWQIATDVIGPGGTSARVAGTATGAGRLNMAVNGDAPMALANPFIAPQSLQGILRYDLQISGPADLQSVSGTITTAGARAAVPAAKIGLNDIAARIALSAGRATVDLTTNVSTGGNLTISGPVGLTGLMPANLIVALNNVVVKDPTLYRTRLDGAISVDGSLLSNARISGQVDVGETLVTVPSTGISSFGTIPPITHVGAKPSVRKTIKRAGLEPETGQKTTASGPTFPLDITINAPQQIFVRGRGLDAELGGSLRITGTSANIISSGRFELVRGRLDILEKRFNLDEGIIQLQGSFDPFLRFVAITSTDAGTASVIVEGLASEPEVSFESNPESPQDEVLAQIFFGRDISQISAIQALQLANAVATLAGRGGESVVSKLRRGFALDDLDITTDDDGSTAVRAGKYISDNIYTDVTVGTQNDAEVSLNIDLTPSITARGSVNNSGNTSLGIFFERDY